MFISYALLGLYYGIFGQVYPIFVLHICLLPLNIIRLYQMKRLISNIKAASAPEKCIEYLIPYMKKGHYPKGTKLFQNGDIAENIYFIQQGSVEIPEIQERLSKGEIFGEVGVFNPASQRSASAICFEDSDIYSIHKDKVLELYYQNPEFGFFIVQLLSRYVTKYNRWFEQSTDRLRPNVISA